MIMPCVRAISTMRMPLKCSGSRDVRLAALRALHCVVLAVGNADDLAFFLPGLASGLARQLLPPSPGEQTSAPLPR